MPIEITGLYAKYVVDHMKRSVEYQHPNDTNSPESRHHTRMALINRLASSRALSQETVFQSRQNLSVRTV